MNKLEKVALRISRRRGKPLVLIINNVHFFKNDDDGRNMLLQLQQKAEAWAASGMEYFDPAMLVAHVLFQGILTLVFSSLAHLLSEMCFATTNSTFQR